MTPPRVAVIVLTHEDYAQRYLRPCYESLHAQTYPAGQVRVFVVNNGGAEPNRRFIQQVAPDARLIDNETNAGWTGGNNRAIHEALEGPFDYFVMLNVDTVVHPEWLVSLVAAADAQPTRHILQSKIFVEGTGRVQSLGNRIQYLGYGYCNGYGDHHAANGHAAPMDYASGAAMLVKRAVFETIGLFRQDYFIYYDDMEFCWRARLAGFNVGFVESSICYHKYEFRQRLTKLYYYERNRLMTLLTLERLGTLGLTAPCLLISEGLMSVYWLARGWGGVRLRILGHFLRPATWRVIRQRRRELRGLRTRRDADIVRHFSATISFSEIDHWLLRYVVNPLLSLYWAVAKRFIVW